MSAKNIKKDALTTRDVAKICKVSTRVVVGWHEKKLLQGYQLPQSNHRRFTIENVRQFLKNNQLPETMLEEYLAETLEEDTKKEDMPEKATA